MTRILRVHLEVSYEEIYFDFVFEPDAIEFLSNLATKRVLFRG